MWLVVACMFFLGAVAVDAAVARTPVPIGPVVRFAIVGALGGFIMMAQMLTRDGVTPDTLGAVLVYGFACELYIFVFTLSLASIGMNMLIAVSASGANGIDTASICESREMVAVRLNRMSFNGLLVVDDGAVRVTRKGATMVRVFSAARLFFRHRDRATT